MKVSARFKEPPLVRIETLVETARRRTHEAVAPAGRLSIVDTLRHREAAQAEAVLAMRRR